MSKRCRCGQVKDGYCRTCQTFAHPVYLRYRLWRYIEPRDPHNEDWEPVGISQTEEQILCDFYPYWVRQMKKAGKAYLINQRNAIEDFIVVHWASEV